MKATKAVLISLERKVLVRLVQFSAKHFVFFKFFLMRQPLLYTPVLMVWWTVLDLSANPIHDAKSHFHVCQQPICISNDPINMFLWSLIILFYHSRISLFISLIDYLCSHSILPSRSLLSLLSQRHNINFPQLPPSKNYPSLAAASYTGRHIQSFMRVFHFKNMIQVTTDLWGPERGTQFHVETLYLVTALICFPIK